MTFVVLCSICLCGYFALRFFTLKKSIRRLTADFKAARENLEGEQHVQVASPDKELEVFAEQLNQYIEAYHTLKYSYEDAVQSIRDEITNLSHDLRTPLTSILGYLDFMKEEKLTDEQEEALLVIKRRAYNLNSLIEQLYEYARVKNGDASMKSEPIDMFKTLREHLLSFYSEFEQKNIDLELRFPEEERPIWVLGDQNYMNRVLVNLTSNTIKYGGEKVLISLVCAEHRLTITYRSFRGALTNYDIVHMFDRFYRKDSARNMNESSGLGLTIAKLYLERMKGSIEARGDEKYLYITCTLPEQRPEQLVILKNKK